MTYLPFDVLMEIFPLLDSSDLPAMALTNRSFSDYALSAIYEHISSQNMQAACVSITSNPSLAQRVKSLEVNRHDHGRHIDSILPAFRDALRVTLNLRALKWDIDGRHSWVFKSALGAFKLRYFSCSAFTDQDLLDFLHDQTELGEIVLTHSYLFPENGPPPWRFSSLNKFTGSMSWIDVIVPHHPVSHIAISYISRGGPLASLGLTTAPIVDLRIPIHALEKRQPGELKRLFSSLEHLVLITRYAWETPTLSIPVSHLLRDVLGALSTVTDFELIGYDLSTHHEEGEQNASNLFKIATEKAPVIRRFLVEYVTRVGRHMMPTSIVVCWTKEIGGWKEVKFESSVLG
ncbi:hypothetical protein MSAN_00413600 [Mycena sanguinolenta]|uniref:F-box domain-containing protein n=1 Tax=Mycena sanguinolenta TaxID=230812 RepID=A0A8H6ZD40_9AGAR|nr:hypothetical protein MSAN_00413600 [Mycena sanguinolenta]